MGGELGDAGVWGLSVIVWVDGVGEAEDV